MYFLDFWKFCPIKDVYDFLAVSHLDLLLVSVTHMVSLRYGLGQVS